MILEITEEDEEEEQKTEEEKKNELLKELTEENGETADENIKQTENFGTRTHSYLDYFILFFFFFFFFCCCCCCFFFFLNRPLKLPYLLIDYL